MPTPARRPSFRVSRPSRLALAAIGCAVATAILAHGSEQLAAARASKRALEAEQRFDRPLVTEISLIGEFTPAETYHQDYYQKNPVRYAYYRRGCRRDRRLETLWGEEAGGGAKTG